MILTVTLNPAIDKVYEVNGFSLGDVFRPSGLWATAGGKGLNVAKVASILGGKVVATGFLGGNSGRFIREQLKSQGIEDAFIEIEGETRTCIAINDPIDNTSTEILESGPTISKEEQKAFLDNFKTIALKADIVTISGSLPKGISNSFYGELIQICEQLGKRAILDTSGKALATNLQYNPFMIKPNRNELETIIGKTNMDESDILKAAQKIHQKEIDLVCITLGGDGSIAVTKEGAFRLKAPPIRIMSAVGSGDSFIAGCALQLIQGEPMQEVLKYGMACGMANTQFNQTGMVNRELVDKYFHMVSIEKY